MTDDELAAIKAREKAAAQGPWYFQDLNDVIYGYSPIAIGGQYIAGDTVDQDTGEFIAHAREDIPALLAEVEAWREIGRALATEEYPFQDGAYQCCWCGLSYMMMPDDATHAPECAITKARALLNH